MEEILCLGDIHASRRPPGWCTESYWPDLLDLLRQSAAVARERQVRAAVWAGDVFHNKAPSKTDHGVVQDLQEVIEAYPCPVYAVAGNHDMQNDRLESVGETQPLGVLFGSGLRELDGWAGDHLSLYGVPWQQEWSAARIRECLAGFQRDLFGPALIVTHAPIYPPDREPTYPGAEVTPARWWAKAVDDGPFRHGIFYGHIHEPHGVYAADDSALRFCNNGAISRGSLDEYNLTRQVGVTLWSAGGGFEFVPLKAKPASEVFRVREREEKATPQRNLEEFLGGVRGTSLVVLTRESVMGHIRQLGAGPDVESLAEKLLESQGGS